MDKILELLDFLDEKLEYPEDISFDIKLIGLMKEARQEYKATLPSPLPDDFVEID